MLMRRLASEGRTVFVSSHLMTEMEGTADHVIVIGRGKLIADTPMADFIARSTGSHVRVVSPQAEELTRLLDAQGAAVNVIDGALVVTGIEAPRVRQLAASAGIILHELTPRRDARGRVPGAHPGQRRVSRPRGSRVVTAATVNATGAPRRIGFGATLASEWSKLWSVRSTWISVGLALLLPTGLAALLIAAEVAQRETRRAVTVHGC